VSAVFFGSHDSGAEQRTRMRTVRVLESTVLPLRRFGCPAIDEFVALEEFRANDSY
jgi:hypothetical protein